MKASCESVEIQLTSNSGIWYQFELDEYFSLRFPKENGYKTDRQDHFVVQSDPITFPYFFHKESKNVQ